MTILLFFFKFVESKGMKIKKDMLCFNNNTKTI